MNAEAEIIKEAQSHHYKAAFTNSFRSHAILQSGFNIISLFFRIVISKSPDNDMISYCFKGELEIVKHSEAEVDEHHATGITCTRP
jgi:hypothetical protein